MEGVLNKEMSNLIAVRSIEIERIAPRCFVMVGEVRAKFSKVISFRAQVVVHHVEYHGEALLMAGIDQAFEAFGATIGVLGCKQIYPVISPVAGTRELYNGHQF